MISYVKKMKKSVTNAQAYHYYEHVKHQPDHLMFKFTFLGFVLRLILIDFTMLPSKNN